MEFVFKINGLTYTYPLSFHPSLKNIHCTIESGKIHGIIGANQSGKTTFCLLLKGYIPQFYKGDLEGSILYQNESLENNSKQIGYIGSDPFSQLSGIKKTVFEEIAFGLENLGYPVDEIKKRVHQVIQDTHLEPYIHSDPYHLSGGQVQRVAIASIMVLQPKTMILDEPTTQLDIKEAKNIFEILKKYKEKGNTVIISEQNSELISQYCDSVLLFNNGELIKKGSPEDIFYDPSLDLTGIEIPHIISITRKLHEHGLLQNKKILDEETFLSELKGVLNRQ